MQLLVNVRIWAISVTIYSNKLTVLCWQFVLAGLASDKDRREAEEFFKASLVVFFLSLR